jgi:F-type H+-transporting ATPase subunit b
VLIDWFTVGAQALNFLVLVWLLKRFLYGPVLAAIAAREKRVAGTLAAAEAREAEALRRQQEYERESAVLAAARASLLREAANDADAERSRLLQTARDELLCEKAKQRQVLALEARELGNGITRRVQSEVLLTVSKALKDLADETLEQRVIDRFIGRLSTLDGGSRAALAEGEGTIVVRSAFELRAPEREALRRVLSETFGREQPVVFDRAPDLICGVEVLANGRKLAWNAADFVGSLERILVESPGGPGASNVSP